MALNSNHTVEELGNIRCAIVEKNISQERVDFLTPLLTGNGYKVVCVAAEAPKPKAKAATATTNTEAAEIIEVKEIIEEIKTPTIFTLGVTDLLFNPINAVFGRLLKTATGHVVTNDYWNQTDAISRDETPYFERNT
jgi:hypothetical protein